MNRLTALSPSGCGAALIHRQTGTPAPMQTTWTVPTLEAKHESR